MFTKHIKGNSTVFLGEKGIWFVRVAKHPKQTHLWTVDKTFCGPWEDAGIGVFKTAKEAMDAASKFNLS